MTSPLPLVAAASGWELQSSVARLADILLERRTTTTLCCSLLKFLLSFAPAADCLTTLVFRLRLGVLSSPGFLLTLLSVSVFIP